MPNKTKRGPSNTRYFAAGPQRTKQNKERKLTKHIKLHPEDLQALNALLTLKGSK